jgi:hypothetical protein
MKLVAFGQTDTGELYVWLLSGFLHAKIAARSLGTRMAHIDWQWSEVSHDLNDALTVDDCIVARSQP